MLRARRRRRDAGAARSGSRAPTSILFDGTLFTDDEMIASGTGEKTGRRMGHMPIDGADGSLAALAGPWQAAHLHPHQQHQSDPDRRLAGAPRASKPPAGKSPPTGWRSRL